MPWLTPENIPEGDDCRPLFIPASTEWLALISGALTELTLSYNWEKFGALTVAETVAKMQEIIDGYYDTPCAACVLPGGGRVIRIGAHGALEELGSDGTWGAPEGDYYIPPPDARTGGTETNQKCLAAKNATNVLDQLYESLSESWAANLSEAEAATAFIEAIVGIVGFEFAPITYGILAFFNVVFGILYAALEYLGADLWDEAFSNQMICFLLDCASNDAGVVTFDWDCFIAQLNSLTDSFGLSEIQIRLYLQVAYILYFIGGVDGLNLAAGTTAITNDDCGACGGWCYDVDLTLDAWGFEIVDQAGWSVPFGVYTSGVGYDTVLSHNSGAGFYAQILQLHLDLPVGEYTKITIYFAQEKGTPVGTNYIAVDADEYDFAVVDGIGTQSWESDAVNPSLLDIDLNSGFGSASPGGCATLTRITFYGVGDNPFGTNNC